MKPGTVTGIKGEEDDAALMTRVADGDRMAFHILVTRYMPLVHAAVYRMHPVQADTEDLVQETLLRIWQKGHLWDAQRGASVSTWIYRIATNLCIDHKRRRKPGSEVELFDVIAAPEPSAEQAMEERQREKIVRRAVDKLPARQRAALVLSYYQGLSNAETAEALKTSVKGVEGLLVRARTALQRELKKHEGALRP